MIGALIRLGFFFRGLSISHLPHEQWAECTLVTLLRLLAVTAGRSGPCVEVTLCEGASVATASDF